MFLFVFIYILGVSFCHIGSIPSKHTLSNIPIVLYIFYTVPATSRLASQLTTYLKIPYLPLYPLNTPLTRHFYRISSHLNLISILIFTYISHYSPTNLFFLGRIPEKIFAKATLPGIPPSPTPGVLEYFIIFLLYYIYFFCVVVNNIFSG